MQNEEAIVNIQDVLIYCLLHWRSAIVVTLIGAIIGSAFYGYRSHANATPTAEQRAEEANNLAESVNYAIDIQEDNVLNLSEYLEQSLLMRINPNNVYVSQATIVITVDETPDFVDGSQAHVLATAYINALFASANIDELADNWDISPAYIRELLSFDFDGQNIQVDIESTNSYSGNSNTGYIHNYNQIDSRIESNDSQIALFTLTAKGSSTEQAMAVRDAVLASIDDVQAQLSVSIASHSYSVVETCDYTTADYALLQRQVECANAVSIASTTLTSNRKSAPSAGEVISSTAGISLKSLFKGSIIGGVAAFLCYGFILCLRYVLDISPVLRGQIEARYALPEVGSYIYGWEGFYRGATGFDRWLRKLAGLEDKPDAARVAEMVAANVRLYAGDVQTLLVSSSVESGKAFELSEALTIQLEDMHIVLANDLANSVDARSQLKVADAVLFVEEYGKSVYESIDAEITLAAETGKMPLGLVMA